ncbi:hypothetical protein RIF29_20623 [Crotalaria pallida]|uniref:Uncharacterized protein n=1 Tax=Crotalaria pallida TaxID=3830 RepID=A0AAN9F1X2_CROPI
MQSGRKETVLDLPKFVDKFVQVKLTGGRQVFGSPWQCRRVIGSIRLAAQGVTTISTSVGMWLDKKC